MLFEDSGVGGEVIVVDVESAAGEGGSHSKRLLVIDHILIGVIGVLFEMAPSREHFFGGIGGRQPVETSRHSCTALQNLLIADAGSR